MYAGLPIEPPPTIGFPFPPHAASQIEAYAAMRGLRVIEVYTSGMLVADNGQAMPLGNVYFAGCERITS